MLKAINQYSRNLEFASKDLQDDEEIVLEAVKRDPQCLNYAS